MRGAKLSGMHLKRPFSGRKKSIYIFLKEQLLEFITVDSFLQRDYILIITTFASRHTKYGNPQFTFRMTKITNKVGKALSYIDVRDRFPHIALCSTGSLNKRLRV